MCCGISRSDVLRVLEAAFCLAALLIPAFRGSMVSPYGAWCEFVWLFGLAVAVTILVLEKLKVNVLLAVFLQHNWADLACGLTLLCCLMLLSASVIYAVVFTCAVCIIDVVCATVSFLALLMFAVDATLAKLKCPQGYLSNGRGILRWAEAFTACILFAAVTSYFLGVPTWSRPAAMIWCVIVYVVCFPVTVVIILPHLLKLLNALLCFALDKLEVVFNAVAVLLYLSAAILWPLYGYRRHAGNAHSQGYHYHDYYDLTVVTVMTFVNLVLYMADLIWSLLALYKRI